MGFDCTLISGDGFSEENNTDNINLSPLELTDPATAVMKEELIETKNNSLTPMPVPTMMTVAVAKMS
jgi:hypothetical protein